VSLNIEELLQEISAESPCGEDISYDAAYLEVERMIQGTPETQFSEGEEANWKDVRERCLELWGRSRNLRVALYLTLALLHQDGVAGLRDGLALLRGLIEKYWDEFHPKLDPEDDNDPLERMNIVASLSPPPETYQDPMKFKDVLMAAPLCSSRQMGTFGLRDMLLASGELTLPAGSDQEVPQMSVINAAFDDTPVEDLQATHQALTESVEHGKTMESLLLDIVGVGAMPNLDEFLGVIQQADKKVAEILARRGYGAEGVEEGGEESAGGGAPVQAAAPGTINSKEDVLRALDRICAFYEGHEPSSPVPLLLKRARRLVGKSFLDIVRDISPDAMSQIEVISGGTSDGYGDSGSDQEE